MARSFSKSCTACRSTSWSNRTTRHPRKSRPRHKAATRCDLGHLPEERPSGHRPDVKIFASKISLTQQAFTSDPNPSTAQAERLFSGTIGTEYHMLDLICPAAAAMSERVGGFVAGFSVEGKRRGGSLNVFEIGCGTGGTTVELVPSRR